MKPVKRIEIIIDSLDLNPCLKELEKMGITGYTVIRDVIGSGDRGARIGDMLNDTMKNSYILIACEPEQVSTVTEALRPKLKRFGGICLISDAQWLKH